MSLWIIPRNEYNRIRMTDLRERRPFHPKFNHYFFTGTFPSEADFSVAVVTLRIRLILYRANMCYCAWCTTTTTTTAPSTDRFIPIGMAREASRETPRASSPHPKINIPDFIVFCRFFLLGYGHSFVYGANKIFNAEIGNWILPVLKNNTENVVSAVLRLLNPSFWLHTRYYSTFYIFSTLD